MSFNCFAGDEERKDICFSQAKLFGDGAEFTTAHPFHSTLYCFLSRFFAYQKEVVFLNEFDREHYI